MKTNSALIVGLLASALTGHARAQTPAMSESQEACSKERIDAVHAFLASELQPEWAGVALVSCDDRITIHQPFGYEDRQGTRPVTTSTAFAIASTTKQFIAAAILKLQEDEKLSLSDPISRFIPEAKPPLADAPIKSLLTHTAGLGSTYIAEQHADRDTAVRAILETPLESKVGETFNYSNDGYSLAAAIVERASGMQLQTYLRQKLFKQAHLENTWFWNDIDWNHPQRGVAVLPVVPGEVHRGVNWANRSWVVMSVADFHRWLSVLDEATLLSMTSVRQLLQPQQPTGDEDQTVSLGWWQRKLGGDQYLYTSGSEDFGAGSMVMTNLDKRVTIIVFAHGERSDNGDGPTPAGFVALRIKKLLFG